MCKKSNIGDNNDEEPSESPSFDTESDNNETRKEEVNITPILSVATMTCISQPQTLKFFGDIKGTKVMMLIDSGIIHNFIDPSVVKNLNIFIYPTANLHV